MIVKKPAFLSTVEDELHSGGLASLAEQIVGIMTKEKLRVKVSSSGGTASGKSCEGYC